MRVSSRGRSRRPFARFDRELTTAGRGELTMLVAALVSTVNSKPAGMRRARCRRGSLPLSAASRCYRGFRHGTDMYLACFWGPAVPRRSVDARDYVRVRESWSTQMVERVEFNPISCGLATLSSVWLSRRKQQTPRRDVRFLPLGTRVRRVVGVAARHVERQGDVERASLANHRLALD